jgi:hypothetical protein
MTMTARRIARSILAIAFLYAVVAPLVIAAAPQATPTPAPPTPVPVRLKLLVERAEGDKPLTSIPFEVVVRANTSDNTSLNHGRSVPVNQTTFLPMATGGVATLPQVSTVYQSIGSNLNIRSVRLNDRTVSFDLMVDVSFVETPGSPATGGNPTFRKFSIQLAVTAKLGESTVVAVSSDRTTNETAKLTVLADLVK